MRRLAKTRKYLGIPQIYAACIEFRVASAPCALSVFPLPLSDCVVLSAHRHSVRLRKTRPQPKVTSRLRAVFCKISSKKILKCKSIVKKGVDKLYALYYNIKAAEKAAQYGGIA